MASLKTCFKCGLTKDRTEFYRHKMMADGLLGKCKECTKEDSNKHRNDNLVEVRAYDRVRGMLPHRVAARLAYATTDGGKAALASRRRRYIARNPEKRAAHIITGNAIRDGRLFVESCEVCGSWKTHAHHDDYSKPLDVRWLCAEHHSLWHQTT
jgi:hypothetical protein